MEDVTIIVQGRISQEAYDFWLENYKQYKVIISTWVDNQINFLNIHDNFRIILSQIPLLSGDQNLNYQLISTINALECVTTKYVIKIRGDEYWSNLENIVNTIKKNEDKIYTSSVFFRHWSFAEYHVSDHLMAGTKENMSLMFKETKHNFDNGKLNVSKWIIDGKFWKWGNTHSPEERLTKSYLNAKHPNKFEKIDGRILMKENFDILNIDVLKPYKIKANCFKVEWRDNFIPERNYSISTIDQLFSDEPYKIPNK
jgi:hypothetical protein